MTKPPERPRYAALTGLGSHVPPRTVTNDDLAELLATTDEWITTRTGIKTRHWAEPGTATSDLALEAAARALRSARLPAEPGTVDAVILATTTPDQPCPATAPQIAARLGLGHCAAYDIAAVCSGFLYALAAAAGQIAAGQARRILVIGAETYSTILNPGDRTTAVIFGDGAGAVVLEATADRDQPGVLRAFDLGSDGTHYELITVPAGGSRQRTTPGEPNPDSHYFAMDGRQVFTQAVTRMADSCRTVLDRLGWPVEQVDHLVGHQANLRILTALARDLGIPLQRAAVHLDRVGNTSAASIPLALDDAHRRGALTPGDTVLLTAFGGGLTWGSAALLWPSVSPP
ncbi:3-oxoacyl-[acyl-carrier-protein] synthase III [Streptomyces sp. TLI_053]|uniref:beta-ketoacyl-ACP synthase III n=1 Tax=Streptomyces sp. TLI_053 TaxID=1855352 RepID=UPI00087D50CD|nr:beta-ketoacyl-ACP synthase III [Streptomyces sp. TLI_053]SDS53829.1 3-oxoacyl-[acyl-carrier-protein] synthase III [Streptomyces sp. TLI_053]